MIEIIPAIDIISGKCVRLSKGDYEQQTVYSESPVEVAKAFEGAGCKRLHLVDLDGAKSNHIVNYKILEDIASSTNLVIDFGGGIKSDEDVHIAFESGAAMITGGSIAVKSPALFESWISKFGPNKIILGADAKDKKIATNGWMDNSEHSIVPFINSYLEKGISKVISTDISKDGMLQGTSIELYTELLDQCPGIYLIASGGVASLDDLRQLEEINVPAVIAGKALYEGRITLKDLENENIRTHSC
ncbi:MAG: 1-(5-phosphoribosyl)-5-[(5-phosphoribosylamino)methylideneamino]imidazole-4-carboxamide isomerase [Muribaculaceae bacterium]|nr:1-(5-phosphoribosyl)-5-[(5-phosphoribosylamino)methylideneamino]imidazole-4-carboxamide isomerase [Muribaculaceae bacterium]